MDHWSCATEFLFGSEVEEFPLEKNIKPEKEDEEKFYIDEKLSIFERTLLLLDSNYDVQKIWAIQQIFQLLRIKRQETLTKLIPKVTDILSSNTNNVGIHSETSRLYVSIIQERLVEPNVIVNKLLPSVLTYFESKNNEIRPFWLNALLEIIPSLPSDVLKHKMLTIVRSMGQLSQPVFSRQTCCRIIGKMAISLEPHWVQQELMSSVKSLAQDVENDVRETMCGELKHLGKSFSKEFCGTFILPEVIELSQDEEMGVRCAAMETIVELLPSLDEKLLEQTVVSLVLRLLNEAESSREMRLRKKVSLVIGQFAHGLKGYLNREQSLQILDLYIKLSQTTSVSDSKLNPPAQTEGITTSSISVVPSVISREEFSPCIKGDDKAECRRLCAYNMPAMMMFADRLKETNKLYDIIKSLSNDKHEKVRRTLACGIHEVISILGDKSQLITKDYARQLQDDNIEVLSCIVEHIPEVVEVLAVAHNLDTKTRHPGLTELIQPLLHFEQIASNCRQWRLHSNLLESLSCLTRCMTSEQLYTKFVPLCWKCIERSVPLPCLDEESQSTTYVLPVKLAASRTLCSFIKYIKKADQRREICSQFIIECARNENHKQRVLFVNICKIILENFSRQFFKEQGFYSALLGLAKDPSSNVRLKVCSLLSQLKTILLLPSDREYQQLFESTISSLLMDKDSETIAAVNCAVKDMDRINYRIQSMITHSLLEEDIIDREREEEEQQLLKEEEIDKEKERERECIVTKLSGDFRRSAPSGGGSRTSSQQSPSVSRAATKKTTGSGTGSNSSGGSSTSSSIGGSAVSIISSTSSSSSSKKSQVNSPGIPRKNSYQGLTTSSGGSGSTPNSPSSVRPSIKVSSSSGTSGTKKSQSRTVDGDDRAKGRRSAGSSPSLSPSNTTSSPATTNRSRSREFISSSSTSSSSSSVSSATSNRSSPSQSTSRKGGASSYGLTYVNKAPPQRGASSFN